MNTTKHELRTWTSKTLSIPVNYTFSNPLNRFTFQLPTFTRKRIHRYRETYSGLRSSGGTFNLIVRGLNGLTERSCCRSVSGETMAVTERHGSHSEGMKFCGLCPFWQTGTTFTSSSSAQNHLQSQGQIYRSGGGLDGRTSSKVSSVAKSFLPTRRRLRLDPANTLYFPYEPGKQVRSAVRIKNRSRSHVAFKFQTTAPKSCYMRPPGGILAPGESIIATVFKFVEQPENTEKQLDQKSKVKFKIMSLKVKGEIDYLPELFDEQKDQVVVEKILRVVFLDAKRPTPALEKLEHQLAEADAEAAVETRKKPPADTGPRVVGEGLVIDEWKERREKYLARQQVEAADSV